MVMGGGRIERRKEKYGCGVRREEKEDGVCEGEEREEHGVFGETMMSLQLLTMKIQHRYSKMQIEQKTKVEYITF